MWQQLGESGVGQCRQTLQHITQVGPRVVPVHPCRLHQAHDDGGPLTCEFTAHELPGAASHRPRLDLPFQVVVVQRHGAVLQVLRECCPVDQHVVDGLGRRAAVGDHAALEFEPLPHLMPQRPGQALAMRSSLVVAQTFELTLDLVDTGEPSQRVQPDGAGAVFRQLLEVPARGRHKPR